MNMKRYNKLVFGFQKKLSFDYPEISKDLIFRTIESNIYSENYIDPPIPKAYRNICGEWYNGFVIERISDGSQFVWVPVGYLDSNATLDGASILHKFGRRNFQNDKFSKFGFYEPLTFELISQIESVKKYGGFYVSRYEISQNKKTGKPQSIAGEYPWTDIDFNSSKKFSAMLETSHGTKSHLLFGSEHDSVLEWFIKSEARTRGEIIKDSTKWGNNWNTKNSPKALVKTGSSEEWCTNNIYDFTGNTDQWTQERNDSSLYVIRGGDYSTNGHYSPASYRSFGSPTGKYKCTGFRVALYIA